MGDSDGGEDDAPQGYTRPELLAEPEWLVEHLDDPSVVLIDCDRPEVRNQRGHLPGAVLLPVHPYLRDIRTGEGIASREQAETIFRLLGVNDESRVILYDSEGGLLAGRVWWVLWLYGFENAAILNGGWPAWITSRHRTTDRAREAILGEVRLQDARLDRLVTTETLRTTLDDPDLVLLDVRADEEWRAGRIPGAVHLEWREFVDWVNATRLKPAPVIWSMLRDAGVPPDRVVVPYCHSGIRAAFATFVLRLMGYERVAHYAGSWAEWS
jgi:thiosulfate/3-mercaptopyruvate sulfurtransferase